MRILMVQASVESFLQLIALVFILAFVLVITYLVTRWIGGYQKAHMKSKNLQIIETIPAGNNKMISLIKTGTVYLVVSVGKEEIHPLVTLSEDQLTDLSFLQEKPENTVNVETFQEIFGQLKDKMSGR